MITIHQSWNQKHINICFQAVAIHLQKRKKRISFTCVYNPNLNILSYHYLNYVSPKQTMETVYFTQYIKNTTYKLSQSYHNLCTLTCTLVLIAIECSPAIDSYMSRIKGKQIQILIKPQVTWTFFSSSPGYKTTKRTCECS